MGNDSDTASGEVSELSHEELRSEWERVVEKIRGDIASDTHPDRLSNRRSDLWNEMKSRVDAEPPACPECDHRSWSQQMGDAKHCNGCGYAPGIEEMELVEEIDDYWETVLAGGEADA